MNKNITIPFTITKVDEEQRRVWGIATSDAVDSQGDILDYEASKKAVTDWMKVGNIREMHDGNRAVGKAFDAQFDDVEKSITVGAYISKSEDGENTWIKVKEGILAGYSVGGQVHKSVVEKAKDAVSGVERAINRVTDWSMSELSLVDNPANPTAQIVMVKSADGNAMDYIDMDALRKALDASLEKHLPKNSVGMPVAWWVSKYQNTDNVKEAMREFEVNQLSRISRIEKRDYSDKTRADMADKGQALPDGSFPIANKTDLANAIKAVGRAKDKATAKKHIISRAKDLDASSMIPDSWNKSKGDEMSKKQEADKLRKDFYGAATLIDCATTLSWFLASEIAEGDTETSEAVQSALEAIKTAAVSELNELDDEEVVAMATVIQYGMKVVDLAKTKKDTKVAKGGEAVVDSDPRDVAGATVAPTVTKPASGGTVVPKAVVGKDGKTTTLVNKAQALEDAGFTKEQAAAIEKIIATTELPAAPPRQTRDPRHGEKPDHSNDDDDEVSDTADGHPDGATPKADNAPKAGDPSDAPISASADGSADAASPAGNGNDNGGTAADPKLAEPAAATGDTPRAADEDTKTSDSADGAADAPTETTDADRDHTGGKVEPTDTGKDDDDEDTDKSVVATLQKAVSELTDKVNKNAQDGDIVKSIQEVGTIVKEIATQQSSFDERLRKIEKQPLSGRPFSSQYPPHEVIKGQEDFAESQTTEESSGLKESEIMDLLKQAQNFEAHPNIGTAEERGAVFRKLWKVKDLDKYRKLLK